jgi:hypothetical protein
MIGRSTASPLHPLGKGARLLQSRTGIRHRSVYYGQMAGQSIRAGGDLANAISATGDVIIIPFQSGDDRLIFTASNISEDAVHNWQRLLRSSITQSTSFILPAACWPSRWRSVACIISALPNPRFETEAEGREPNCTGTDFRIRDDASTKS